MSGRALLGGALSTVGAVALVLVQNGDILIGVLSVARSQIAPHVSWLTPETLTPVLFGFAVLWVLFGLYRVGTKIAAKLS